MPLRRRRLCSASSPALVPIAAARTSPMAGSLRAYAVAIASMAQS
ncbi:hypothetical protein ABZV14_43520 [Streptosporangium canum]